MNMILETGVCDEATQQPVENPQPANIAVRVGSTPGAISLVPAPRMVKRVKRGYRVHAMTYGVGAVAPVGQAGGDYEVISPIGTRLCVGKKAACDFITAALNYYDPEGECAL